MLRKAYSKVLVGALLIAAAHAQAGIIAQTSTFHRTLYLLDRGTWHEKEAEAIALGGHLTTIWSSTMNEQILNFWRRYQDTWGLWIGLNDADNEGVFVWASGWLWVDPNWAPSEPNGGTRENYVYMDHFGTWNDSSSEAIFQAIAEVPIPEPGTVAVGVAVAGVLLAGRTRRSQGARPR